MQPWATSGLGHRKHTHSACSCSWLTANNLLSAADAFCRQAPCICDPGLPCAACALSLAHELSEHKCVSCRQVPVMVTLVYHCIRGQRPLSVSCSIASRSPNTCLVFMQARSLRLLLWPTTGRADAMPPRPRSACPTQRTSCTCWTQQGSPTTGGQHCQSGATRAGCGRHKGSATSARCRGWVKGLAACAHCMVAQLQVCSGLLQHSIQHGGAEAEDGRLWCEAWDVAQEGCLCLLDRSLICRNDIFEIQGSAQGGFLFHKQARADACLIQSCSDLCPTQYHTSMPSHS